MGTWRYEAAVERDKTQELAKLTKSGRLGILLDGGNFIREGTNARGIHNVPQELQGGLSELTFVWVDD